MSTTQVDFDAHPSNYHVDHVPVRNGRRSFIEELQELHVLFGTLY